MDIEPGRGETSAPHAGDLRYIREVLERSSRVFDPHAEYFAWWGAVVLVWYPAANLLIRAGHGAGAALLGAAALVAGGAGSWRIRARREREGRDAVEDPELAGRVARLVGGVLGAAAIVSFVGPATRTIAGAHVPLVWGLAYAQLAFTLGLLYSREFAVAGAAIFAACLVAMAFPEWNGVILGPAMGIGMIVPARRAAARVRAAREALVGGA
jgi:hypothetical protein